MIVTQIIPAPTPKIAVTYNPAEKTVNFLMAEIIGLVSVADDEGDEQLVPCYLVANRQGYFWVPELEYDFICYLDKEEMMAFNPELFKDRLIEIEAQYQEAVDGTETIQVESKGNVRTIHRIKKKAEEVVPPTEDNP
jgi:hypothetical protein